MASQSLRRRLTERRKNRQKRLLTRHSFRPLGEQLENRTLLAAVSWDGGGGSNRDWFQALNWVGDVVPGVEDVAVIDLPGTYTVTLSADPTVAGLTLGGNGSHPTLN